MARSSYNITLALIVLFVGMVDLSIVLEDNGYSNILVAISKDIPQPDDGGIDLLDKLKTLLTQTSAVLFKATENRVYFKDIDILIPSSWTSTAIQSTNTITLSYQLADIRLDSDRAVSGALPHTSHSGKCGVTGDFITLPIDYVMDVEETIEVQAKGLVQQWAQFRYGVFEEHGFPNDDLLPYFYRHPDGYDAVSSSNDTEIKGDLKSLSGGDCEVDANGIISNQGNCRFIPNATDQTATTSLMSFHWLESVIGFSEISKHDKRPPHRQNRLCSSRSSSEIMANLPDFSNVDPIPSQNTIPEFRQFQNKMIPVVYIAVDTSKPSNPNNTLTQQLGSFRRGLTNLFITLSDTVPDTLVAWSTFENVDSGSEDSYLKEELPAKRIEDGKGDLDAKVNSFAYSESVLVRDVSAVIRDAESRLRKYKDVGGSILYVVTSNESETNDTVTEMNLAEKLLLNNIKLVVAESGPNLRKDLFRISVLSKGSHYFTPAWDNTFTSISREIVKDCENGLTTERRTITSKKDSIQTSNPWTGSFSIDETVGKNTTIVLQSPKEGSFTITLTDPSGSVLTLQNEPEVNNWNYPDSSLKVVWQRIADTATIGRWNYRVEYDASSCSTCDTEPEIHLQIGSSIRSETSSPLPKIQPWVSLSPGSDFVDLSQHPTVIQVRFDSAEGRLGGLTATANIFLDSVFVASIPLFDTGLMDSDVAKDGTYSGIFYPDTDGIYTINFYAVHGNPTKKGSDRLLSSDQNSYCCGSSLPTITSNYFEITANEAVHFQAQNAQSQVASPIVSDFQGNTYGVDSNLVYAELKWTVPFNTISQTVKYSEDYETLVNACESALDALVVYDSLDDVNAGTPVYIYVSAPYTKDKNVYFVVETTGKDETKVCSNLVWTERNPPAYIFTTPGPTSSTISTTTGSTSTTTTSTTSLPTTEASTSTSQETSTEPITSTESISSTTESSTMTTDDPSTEVTSSSNSTTVSSTLSSSTTVSSTSTIGSSTITVSTTDNSIATDSTISTQPTTEVSTTEDPTTEVSTTDGPTTEVSTTDGPTTEVSTTDGPTTEVSTTEGPTTEGPTTEVSTTEVSTTEVSTTEGPATEVSTTEVPTTTEVPITTEDPGNEGLTGAQIGYIAGGVVGGIVVIGAITGGVMFYKKKQSGTGNSLPASNSNYDRGEGREGGYSNSRYQSSTPYTSPSGGMNNSRQPDNQVQNFDEAYDNIGVTIEDDDMLMTAM